MISPLFSDIIRGVIDDVVASIVVLPNKIAIPLTNIDPYELKYPLPDVSEVPPWSKFSLSLSGPSSISRANAHMVYMGRKLALHIYKLYG